MNRPVRTTLTLLLALVLASPLALPVLAQPTQPAMGGPGGGPGGHFGPAQGAGQGRAGQPFPLGRIARALELSEAQVEQARGLLEDHVAAVQPLREESQALREELHGLLEGDAPDAAAIGTRVIRIHQLQDQTRTARQDFEAAFETLLTPEQQERWDLLQDIRLFLGGGRR